MLPMLWVGMYSDMSIMSTLGEGTTWLLSKVTGIGGGVVTADAAYEMLIRCLGILRDAMSKDLSGSFVLTEQKRFTMRWAYALNFTLCWDLRCSMFDVKTFTDWWERKEIQDCASINLVLSHVSRSFKISVHAFWFCLVKIALVVSYFIVRSIEGERRPPLSPDSSRNISPIEFDFFSPSSMSFPKYSSISMLVRPCISICWMLIKNHSSCVSGYIRWVGQ
jgi:hypothetical protein